MLRDWWGDEQHNCLKEQDFLAAVNFQIEQSSYKLLLQDFPTGAALGPFAPPRADSKLIVQVCRGWRTFWEMLCSPGNCPEWQQIEGSAGKDKAMIPGEPEYGNALLSPSLSTPWKSPWAAP